MSEQKQIPVTAAEKIALMNAQLKPLIEGIHKGITFSDGKITIQLQVGHPNEPGAIPGCYPTHAIQALVELHRYYNTLIPSRETSLCITKLEEAFAWLEMRRLDRQTRGVLQTDKT